jgi:hypothetical protein
LENGKETGNTFITRLSNKSREIRSEDFRQQMLHSFRHKKIILKAIIGTFARGLIPHVLIPLPLALKNWFLSATRHNPVIRFSVSNIHSFQFLSVTLAVFKQFPVHPETPN